MPDLPPSERTKPGQPHGTSTEPGPQAGGKANLSRETGVEGEPITQAGGKANLSRETGVEGEPITQAGGKTELSRQAGEATAPGEPGSGKKAARRGGWTLNEEPTDEGNENGRTPPDNAAFRLAAIGALLVVVLFAGYGLGRLNNGTTAAPAATTATPAPSASVVDESQPHAHGTTAPVPGGAAGAVVGGLSLSSGGLTLAPLTTSFTAGRAQKLEFTINGAGGAPVTTYAVVHDKPLHLIVIRRDLTGFQHLHPVMAPDGTWSVDLTLAAPGSYRMIADFTALVGGTQVPTTLGGDLTVAGSFAPVTLPDPARAATAESYQVTYEGTPVTESTQPLLMTVTEAGKPVTVEPYLGAFGHLVVLRQGDTGYVHVHPETQLVDGKVKFWLAAPSPGTYRMFFDFQAAGKVSTAAWTVIVS